MRRGDRGTIIYENITENATWSEDGSPYLVSGFIYIINKSVLDIEPGVRIIFQTNSKLLLGGVGESPYENYESDNFSGIGPEGFISAIGNSHEKILFIAEDIENSGGRIIVNDDSSFVFEHCNFYFTEGFALVGSNDCVLSNCTLFKTGYYLLDEAEYDNEETYPNNNQVSYCNFIHQEISIKIKSDGYEFYPLNRFFLNNFVNNSKSLENGDRSTSIWNKSNNQGNYWSDYNGSDFNEDGVGDTDLPWNQVDYNPLMMPVDSDDNDFDGIPDIWETSNGLDPQDETDSYIDSDYDNLTNLYEYIYGTDPNSPDTDGDGINDDDELYIYNTDPGLNDTDGDGFLDGWEVDNDHDPLDPNDPVMDADSDGVSDEEDAFPDDPNEWNDTDSDGLGDNSDLDIDGDGWNNTVEIDAGTNPYNDSSFPSDIDGDGIPDIFDDDIDGDGWNNTEEEKYGTYPYSNLSYPDDQDRDHIPDGWDNDIDGDMWNNTIEEQVGTDPRNPEEIPPDMDGDWITDELDNDTDGDGWIDSVEEYLGHDPLDRDDHPSDMDGDGIIDRWDDDIDGDGWNNHIERSIGTDLRDNTSFPPSLDESDDVDGDGIDNKNDSAPYDPRNGSNEQWYGLPDPPKDDVESTWKKFAIYAGIVSFVTIAILFLAIFFTVRSRNGKKQQIEIFEEKAIEGEGDVVDTKFK